VLRCYSSLQAAVEQGVPSLSEAEEAYSAVPGGSADVSQLQAERQRSRMRLSSIARLEQVASPFVIGQLGSLPLNPAVLQSVARLELTVSAPVSLNLWLSR